MSKDKFYITTPIYYINASPHIGHSYTNIASDCLARYYRLKGYKVHFLTGTDEHGQKVQQSAINKGLQPRDFADKAVLVFKELWQKLNISYDDFVRTTDERHIKIVQRALEILYRRGRLYEDLYEGWYCTPCETFWQETQLDSQNCPDCKRPLEKITEKNYFFKLSEYQNWLIEYIKNHANFIRPLNRRQEVLSFLELNKLVDLCISRPKERLSWGIPLPFSKEHVTYVWFDALINYLSAVGTFDANDSYQSEWWPADVHLIGKDILRQHAIYWPIILHALDIELPQTIFAHGWWLVGESKMSKSRGNVISPLEMADNYGIDVYRYFLLRDVPFGHDGNFSEAAIVKRLNSDLANDLGNLVYRTLTMIEKYFDGRIPNVDLATNEPQAKKIIERIELLPKEIVLYLTANSDFDFSLVLEKVWELINLANKYIEDTKPWNLVKERKEEQLKAFINLLVKAIREVSNELLPFMPSTATSILEQFGKENIIKGKPLFPRIIEK
ncbi:MAG: methionine--tRNA ligase [Candidatus Omnitrophota bacterium]|nr:methionine--tRNA ligase [Candidatus Omnitrophota bacterium]